ncbi:MAG TPA: cupin domain-containing protein [Chitinophagaceae bacterium]|nr:cupin domain-containing protein [Chitinophagaceae bacterium]
MEKITKPNVKPLAQGTEFNAKQMSAKGGDLLPAHTASLESVLIILEGECVLTIDGKENVLKPGDSFIVPPKIKHQIRALTDFRAVHVMTNDIEFEFFN